MPGLNLGCWVSGLGCSWAVGHSTKRSEQGNMNDRQSEISTDLPTGMCKQRIRKTERATCRTKREALYVPKTRLIA